jgi:hypothetical protein
MGSQTVKREAAKQRLPYTGSWCVGCPGARARWSSERMVQSRIKPYYQEVAETARRAAQLRIYRRNQVFGLVLVASAILLVWLLRTNPKWIFPPGWWRP